LKALFTAEISRKMERYQIVLEYGMLSEPKVYEKKQVLLFCIQQLMTNILHLTNLKRSIKDNQTDKNGKLVVLMLQIKIHNTTVILLYKEKDTKYYC
jgi:molecular chaperone HtpG